MAINTGWQQRLEFLRRDAHHKILDPLQLHQWNAAIEQEVESGEYLVIAAERGGHRHAVALLYTSATDNAVYKRLAHQTEHIFFNGAPYMVESYAHGVTVPVGSADDFHGVLLQWNEASADGKFVPLADDVSTLVARPPQYRMLLSEEPIKAIWLRLRQLQSITLSKRLIVERARRENVNLSDSEIASKAEGVAYALRNASDYYYAQDGRNVSQKILNLYYGNLSFAFAEILASPNGPRTLSEIEDSTKQGHGLYTLDGLSGGLEQVIVGVIRSGFFTVWTKSMDLMIDTPPEGRRKPSQYRQLVDLPIGSWITIESLFARIPEVSDLYSDIFNQKPGWVTPAHDTGANAAPTLFGKSERSSRSYVLFVDDSGRLTKEDIAAFPGPISEITEVKADGAGRHFRVAIDHRGKNVWLEALQVHRSPFKRDALILPIFGTLAEYRSICVVLLYALSIVVRYRPSLWRRVQEGDLDHMRVLIEAFLAVAERVLPEQFLEKVTGQPMFMNQPGSFFA